MLLKPQVVDVEINPIFKSMKDILDGLNAEQRAVVMEPRGATLVVAGAGSGKTTTLTRRVAWQINQGMSAHEMLLLTFTRAAANNMIERARALAPDAQFITGGTFHAVAANLLRDVHGSFGLPNNYAVLDPDDAQSVVKNVLTICPFPDPDCAPKPSSVYSVISLEANMQNGMEEALLKKGFDDLVKFAPWFNTVRQKFAEYKIERGMVDYDDLLALFAIMSEDDTIGPQLRRRWPNIMVDEHQDCNALQMRILYGLGGNDPGIMAVGDPAQAIYGFRGSAPATMFDFQRHWPQTRVLKLEVNYRSTQKILDLVNAVDRSMNPRFERELHAFESNIGEPLPELVACPDAFKQAEKIADFIKEKFDDGENISEQAVLVRSAYVARPIEAALTARGIPYRFLGGLRIDEAAHVKDLLSLARIADNPLYDVAWMRILPLLPGLGTKGAANIAARVGQIEGSASEKARKMNFGKNTDPSELIKALLDLEGPGTPGQRLRKAAKSFDSVFKARYKEEWTNRSKDLEAIALIGDGSSTMNDFLTKITLDYSVDRKSRNGDHQEDDMVTVSTIHSSKGLEWEYVHIPGFCEGSLPAGYAKDRESVEEERRVFYVAVSRTKRYLKIYRPLLKAGGPMAGMNESSIFESDIKEYVKMPEQSKSCAVPQKLYGADQRIKMLEALLKRNK